LNVQASRASARGRLHFESPDLSLRVAIVSDALTIYGGAERVLESIIDLYPQADLFALVDFVPPDSREFLRGKPVETSFIQRVPGARRWFRRLFPLWPLAIEQFDLSGYDLVICNHYSVAHGAITSMDQVQVSYTHSPMRYAWDLQHQYLREAGLASGPMTLLARPMLHRARLWDQAASARVGHFAANSRFVASRIQKYYRRRATVINPPVPIEEFVFHEEKDDFYLFLGRLVPYKRVDLLIDAFAKMPGRKLLIAGDGPLYPELLRRAPPNVTLLGRVSQARAVALMSTARAYVYPAIEDFGIAPLEAQASGTPVIALRKGGLCETICTGRRKPNRGVLRQTGARGGYRRGRDLRAVPGRDSLGGLPG